MIIKQQYKWCSLTNNSSNINESAKGKSFNVISEDNDSLISNLK